MPGQMQWRSPNPDDPNDTKVLYYRNSENEPWRMYTDHPDQKSDYVMGPIGRGIGGRTLMGSRGFATMQKLLRLGYELIPSPGVAPQKAPMMPLSGLSEEARQELLKKSLVRP